MVTSGVWSRIKGLGINKRQRWKRGGTCCKWKRAQKPQPVVHSTAQECSTPGQLTNVNNTVESPSRITRGVNFRNLIQIPFTHEQPKNKNFHIGYLNARSVKNKTIDISDFIVEEKLDVLCVTEPWLRDDGRDDPVITEMLQQV